MRVLLIVFVALVCGSCFEKGDCVINNTNLIKINFIKQSDKSAYKIAFKSVEVEGTSLVLYSNVEASTIQLPVDPTKEETAFILNYGDTSTRLKFTYRNQTIIPSADCGAYIYQDEVTLAEGTLGTSIKRTNAQLLRNATVNFEIYF